MRSFRSRPIGWQNESHRHALAAKGIRTRYDASKDFLTDPNKLEQFRAEKAKEDEAAAKKAEYEAKVKADEDRRNNAKAEEDSRNKEQQEFEEKRGNVEKVSEILSPQSVFDLSVVKGRTPKTQAEDVAGEDTLKRLLTEDQYKRRPFEQLVENVRQGDTAAGVQYWNSPGITVDERARLKIAFNELAVQRAQAFGKDAVPQEWVDQGLISADAKKRIDLMDEAKQRELESPGKKFAREVGKETLIGVASAPEVLGAAAGSTLAEGLTGVGGAGNVSTDKKEFVGLAGEMDGLGKNPFFANNVFVGHEEDGYLSPGWVDDLNKMPAAGRVTDRKLDTAFGWGSDGGLPKMTGTILDEPVGNVVLGGRVQDYGVSSSSSSSDSSPSKKVESLYNQRSQIAAVDVKPFKKGEAAFRKGDREQLVKSIIELESQEGQFRDRWNVIEQTHQRVLSSSYDDKGYFGGLVNGGAQKLADDTRKLNELKAKVKTANYEVASRRKILKADLQRLDSQIPPDTSVPMQVQRFDGNSKGWLGG